MFIYILLFIRDFLCIITDTHFYVFINCDDKADEEYDGEIYKQPTLERFWNNEELDY